MAKVQIAEAYIGENGAIGNFPGNQIDAKGELRINSWRSSGWQHLYRCKDQALANIAAQVMIKIINSGIVGYDQGDRNTLWKGLDKNNWDVDSYIASGERTETDCSALVYAAYCVAIPKLREYYRKNNNAPATSNSWNVYSSYPDYFYTYTLNDHPDWINTPNFLTVGDMINKPGKHIAMVCSTDGTSPVMNIPSSQSPSASTSSYSSTGASSSSSPNTVSGLSTSTNNVQNHSSSRPRPNMGSGKQGVGTDISTIYNKIFPLGAIDDNNNYVDLPGGMISTVQLIEPSIKVTEFNVLKKDKYDKNNQPDKYAYRIPLVSIDDMQIKQVDITSFKIDYRGFVPTIVVEFVDTSNTMLSTGVVRDGSIIKVYVGGNGDTLYYKPIRQDFVVTGVKKTGGGDQNNGGYIRYRVYGKLNIPYGYRKEAWCDGELSAMQTLFNLCVYTGLGFATNFIKSNTLDVMRWRNNDDGTYFDFMESIANHACYSPNTFFTSFIDQYNVLNFVECHSLLSHGGKKSDMPAMIYKCYPPQEFPEFDPTKDEKTSRNQLPLNPGDDEKNNMFQKASYYFISNNEFFNGWSNFIEEYVEINNTSTTLTEGYKRHVTYTDSNVGCWKSGSCEFVIRPIDNLMRDSSTQVINCLDPEPSQNSYIPLNLAQTNRKEYSTSAKDSVDDMTNIESFSAFGEVDTTNMFKQYFFSEAQNEYQMKCLKKCGLLVTMQNYNPSITKFSRIWVDIYDKNLLSNSEISKVDVYNSDSAELSQYKNQKNDNILKFDDEGVIDTIENEKMKNKNFPRGEFNRSLSGWYVVTEMEIFYDADDRNIKMRLKLNRIEYQPCFKDEYAIAKAAIDKYREDNIIEDLIYFD